MVGKGSSETKSDIARGGNRLERETTIDKKETVGVERVKGADPVEDKGLAVRTWVTGDSDEIGRRLTRCYAIILAGVRKSQEQQAVDNHIGLDNQSPLTSVNVLDKEEA